MPFDNDEHFLCPYCGQINPLLVDITAGSNQEFVVDCEVCCAPILVRMKIQGDEIVSLDIQKENE